MSERFSYDTYDDGEIFADSSEFNRVESTHHVGAISVRRAGVIPPDASPVAWKDEALCANSDPDAFFPEKGGSPKEAKKVCAKCDVQAQCLEYALATGERFGIWGGLTAEERRKLRR